MSGCTVYTLFSVHFVLPVRFSDYTLVRRVIVNPVLCTQDGVYCSVHMYRVPVYCGSDKTALNRFIVQAYTPEVGQLQCFHPSSLSILLTLCVRPLQRGTTGQ